MPFFGLRMLVLLSQTHLFCTLNCGLGHCLFSIVKVLLEKYLVLGFLWATASQT